MYFELDVGQGQTPVSIWSDRAPLIAVAGGIPWVKTADREKVKLDNKKLRET